MHVGEQSNMQKMVVGDVPEEAGTEHHVLLEDLVADIPEATVEI